MFHYKSCGLQNVYLVNGYIVKETPYGKSVAIEDVEGLHKMIALTIVKHEGKISGAEFRFLRKFLDLSQAKLGALMGVTDQSIAKYEKGLPTETAERFIRLLVAECAQGKVNVLELLEEVSNLDKDGIGTKLYFKVDSERQLKNHGPWTMDVA